MILPLDSQRTFRVFENLIINITKYAMPNTRVFIDIIENEDDVANCNEKHGSRRNNI